MAIILNKGRPAFPVTALGQFDLKGEWKARLEPHRERILRATGAVARVLVENHPHDSSWVGTAFVCGPRLAFTASFNIKNLLTLESAGEHAALREGIYVRLEFVDGHTLHVERVVFVHPYYRVALLELEDCRHPDAIPIASAVPEDLGGKEVVLFAYASRDPRNPSKVVQEIWGDDFDPLFIQPGRVKQIGRLGAEAPGLLHDCSSASGSSGGLLLDASSGEAVGLHTAGTALLANYAELLWDVARDPVVWKHPIAFRPDPRPSWIDKWQHAAIPATPALPARSLAEKRRGWTVDIVPIDFASPEYKALERALYGVIADVEVAMNLALDAGVTRGTVDANGAAQLVWRRILERASGKGVLRNLIQIIHEAPEYAGLAAVTAQVL